MGALTVGAVVVLPFPYSDFSRVKNRPAIVVGKAEFNNVIVCQITSRTTSKRAIPIADRDFSHGGLRAASFARPDKLFTVERSLILEAIGTLEEKKLATILREVRSLFV